MNKLRRPLRRLAESIGKRVAPKTFARLNFRRLGRTFREPELHLLKCLCDRSKTSLDIGASEGLYTAHMLGLSKHCVAFEPRPGAAASLREVLQHMRVQATVESVALSDRVGETKLRMLVEDPGRSTIEGSNELKDEDGSDSVEITVPVRRLDDYAFDNVGFVKIDVEGHELAVLKGGEQTIRRNRPSLLVEIEDRHRRDAVSGVTTFLNAIGYSGFFLHGNQVRSVEEFDITLHQDSRNIGGWKSQWQRKGIYINNFIFVPSERAECFVRSIPADGKH